MRTWSFGILITCLALVLAVLPAGAQPVTADDARSVAQNWVALKISQQGDWGGSPTAQIGEIREFRQGDRLIGYFCPVSPQGFIVISLRRDLAPVKAYSDTSNLDPDANDGPTALIKETMVAALDEIAQKAGPVESVSSSAVTPLVEFNYLGAWDVLDTAAPASDSKILAMKSTSNYQQGGILLTTQWHQFEPYYNECPVPPSPAVCSLPHCAVGCVATADAQIFAYWDWPPTGIGSPYSDTFDWPLMTNQYIWDQGQNRWEDGDGNALTQANIDAVAELSHELGIANAMDYCSKGDCESYSAPEYVPLQNHFRYGMAATALYRKDYTDTAWFDEIKTQINRNWPILYSLNVHVVVADGWKESNIGGNILREYHMNYGWEDQNANMWYVLDNLTLGGDPSEGMIINLYPAPALGWLLSGTYSAPSYPYRYFDADAWGDSATFSPGQNLQFLPGIKATCNSETGTAIRFDGTSPSNTRLFTRGDTSKGAVIRSGTIKLKPGGSVRLP